MSFWHGRRVALTGATGFVGHHVAMQLRHLGAEVVALVRPTSRLDRLRQEGVECRIAPIDDAANLAQAIRGSEMVFHVAGAVGFGGAWADYYRVNVQGTANVLAAARRVGVRRLIHTSSIAAVGASTTPTLLTETAAWTLKPYRVPYVTTKRWAEDRALSQNRPDLEVVVVNPASVVGPDDFSASEFGTLCRRFWKGRIPFHFGGGNNFVDVRDVATGHLLAAERGRPGERYLLTGENRSYQEFFRDLRRIAQRLLPCIRLPNALAKMIGILSDCWQRNDRPYLSSAQAGLMGLHFFFDGSKAKNELGYQPRTLIQSLSDAYAFWLPAGSRRSAAA